MYPAVAGINNLPDYCAVLLIFCPFSAWCLLLTISVQLDLPDCIIKMRQKPDMLKTSLHGGSGNGVW